MKITRIIALGFLLLAGASYAESRLLTVNSFNDLQKLIEQSDKHDMSNTLLVMDDDDTLSTMSCPDLADPDTCQYIGGPAWGAWQGSLLGTKSHYLVGDTVEELFAIAGLLLDLNDMDYSEAAIPDVLSKLTTSGVKLLVLTARGSSDVSATEHQFAELNVKGEKTVSLLNHINDHALKNKRNQLSSLAGPFIPTECGATRNVSYQQGVMYVAGQNKGKMLQCLLGKTASKEVTNIFFIDDTLQNVVDVNNAFKDSKKYQITALHYTYLQKKKDNLTKGPLAEVFQKNAHVRWETIKEVLKAQLQKPAVINQ